MMILFATYWLPHLAWTAQRRLGNGQGSTGRALVAKGTDPVQGLPLLPWTPSPLKQCITDCSLPLWSSSEAAHCACQTFFFCMEFLCAHWHWNKPSPCKQRGAVPSIYRNLRVHQHSDRSNEFHSECNDRRKRTTLDSHTDKSYH